MPSSSITTASPLLRPPAKSSVLTSSAPVTRPRGLSNRSKPPSSILQASVTAGGLLSIDTNAASSSHSIQTEMKRGSSATSAAQKDAQANSPRKRSSSIVSVQEIQPTYDEALDQETSGDC